jgi:phosphate:Na+ symporter
MMVMTFKLLGGIGLFLLGMVLLTDGLKAFAGDALRRALVRFTGTPVKAFGSGALVTVMVQSSSATTVTLIGFVSAGLLTFPQAVGVVFGASLGTTGTGWIVSVLGLKVSLGFYALPLVGIGAFLRLLGSGRWKSLGLALAGFGLIFVGIETLQEAMQALSGVFNLAALPFGGLWGHLLAMAIGILMTVVLQSSSAAVATTLTALHTDTVNFDQAAAVVIGSAIGTTITGALAAIGGSVPAKRTALAHVLFNLATGLIAVILLPAFLWGIGLAQEHLGMEAGATSLAAFHTAFIAVGVAIFLPFVNHFAHGIERLLPSEGPRLTRHLDDTLLQAPAVALEATRRALTETAWEMVNILQTILSNRPGENKSHRVEIHQALEQIQQFFARIPPVAEDEPLSQSRLAQMHAIDHLMRLQSRLNPPAGVRHMLSHDLLQPAAAHSRDVLKLAAAGLHGLAQKDWLATIEQSAMELATLRQQERLAILRKTVGSNWGPFEALGAMDTMRWFERVSHHTWRICNYLMRREEEPESPLAEKQALLDE